MPDATIARATVFEDAGCSLMARVVGTDGAVVTQSSVTAITCKVFDAATGGTAVSTPTVVVATSVFNTLQTDDRWTVDDTGYNFRYDLAASVLTAGNKLYRVEFLFDPASGEDFWAVFELTTLGVMTS